MHIGRIVGCILISLVCLTGLVGGCSWSGAQTFISLASNRLLPAGFNYHMFKWCFNGLPFIDQLDSVLADKTYLIVLQNNRELRPSGGFMGSYAKLHFLPTGLAEFTVQDIYVPDGQLVGHVDPPLPIQQAFGQGWWKLRDANWDPDFTVAGPQIAWFFDQGGETVDGLVAINLGLVNQFLAALGEVKTVDFSETISAQTFYDLAQKYAEVGFFPGSTQKRDFLGAVGNALRTRIVSSSIREKLQLAKIVWLQLKQGEILLWFEDPQLQQTVAQRHWDGGLGDYSNDYLYLVETNLGANKANCCVTRQVIQEITGEADVLTVRYHNANPFQNPKPPYFWGGDYVNYLRVIVPAEAEVQGVKVAEKALVEKALDNRYGVQTDRYQIDKRDKFQIIGLWAVVPASGDLIAEVEYTHRLLVNEPNSVLVKKQPGMEKFNYRLVVDGEVVADDTIGRDKEYQWTK